jgi:hypothetical protein
LPSIEEWRNVLKKAPKNGRFVGVDERAYPAHFGVFGRYHWALEKIPDRYPIPEPLPLSCFQHFLDRSGGRYAVRIGERC